MAYFKKDELIEAARHFGVEFSPNDNKDLIYAGIIEANKTDEDIAAFLDGRNNVEQQEPATEDAGVAEQVEETTSDEPEEETGPEDEQTEVLIKYVGSNSTYTYGRRTFNSRRPFRVVSKDEAQDMLKSASLVRASEEELRRFYNL